MGKFLDTFEPSRQRAVNEYYKTQGNPDLTPEAKSKRNSSMWEGFRATLQQGFEVATTAANQAVDEANASYQREYQSWQKSIDTGRQLLANQQAEVVAGRPGRAGRSRGR